VLLENLGLCGANLWLVHCLAVDLPGRPDLIPQVNGTWQTSQSCYCCSFTHRQEYSPDAIYQALHMWENLRRIGRLSNAIIISVSRHAYWWNHSRNWGATACKVLVTPQSASSISHRGVCPSMVLGSHLIWNDPMQYDVHSCQVLWENGIPCFLDRYLPQPDELPGAMFLCLRAHARKFLERQ